MRRPAPAPENSAIAEATRRALASPSSVLRLPPAAPRLEVVVAALAARGGLDALVLAPTRRDAEALAQRLGRLGRAVALQPEAWAEAAGGGCVVVGSRASAFAPVGRLGLVVVLDAHSEAYVEQRAPDVGRDRRRGRAGPARRVPCLFVSPCPTLGCLASSSLVTLEPAAEQAGWATVEVIDRRGDDPRSGLFSARFAEIVRASRRERPRIPVVCVLNRTGRARLLACGACRALVRCERCGSALVEAGGVGSALGCPGLRQGAAVRCAACGSARLRRLRLGTARAAEEIAALVGEPVDEVSSATARDPGSSGRRPRRHRGRAPPGAPAASAVVFLDFDQELPAPRFRAAEEALALSLWRAGSSAVAALREPPTGDSRGGSPSRPGSPTTR